MLAESSTEWYGAERICVIRLWGIGCKAVDDMVSVNAAA